MLQYKSHRLQSLRGDPAQITCCVLCNRVCTMNDALGLLVGQPGALGCAPIHPVPVCVAAKPLCMPLVHVESSKHDMHMHIQKLLKLWCCLPGKCCTCAFVGGCKSCVTRAISVIRHLLLIQFFMLCVRCDMRPHRASTDVCNCVARSEGT